MIIAMVLILVSIIMQTTTYISQLMLLNRHDFEDKIVVKSFYSRFFIYISETFAYLFVLLSFFFTDFVSWLYIQLITISGSIMRSIVVYSFIYILLYIPKLFTILMSLMIKKLGYEPPSVTKSSKGLLMLMIQNKSWYIFTISLILIYGQFMIHGILLLSLSTCIILYFFINKPISTSSRHARLNEMEIVDKIFSNQLINRQIMIGTGCKLSNRIVIQKNKSRFIITIGEAILKYSNLEDISVYLYHELGHAKLKHHTRLKWMIFFLTLIFILISIILFKVHFIHTFGTQLNKPELYLIIAHLFFKPFKYFMKIIINIQRKYYEIEADRFAMNQLGKNKCITAISHYCSTRISSSIIYSDLYEAFELQNQSYSKRINSMQLHKEQLTRA